MSLCTAFEIKNDAVYQFNFALLNPTPASSSHYASARTPRHSQRETL